MKNIKNMKKIFLSLMVMTGLVMMVGVVSAVHTSDVTIVADDWLTAETSTDFTIDVTNNGVDSVSKVVINIPLEYSNLVCGSAPTNWELYIDNGATCAYRTTADLITLGNSEEFTLEAKTSSDVGDAWLVTSVDTALNTDDNSVIPTGWTIQDAIDNAHSGSTIYVPAGIYTEDLTIDESVTLRGDSKVTIKGEHTIVEDDVILDGFTFSLSANGTIFVLDSSSALENVEIKNSIFNMPVSPAVGIVVGTNQKVSDVVMTGNTFNGPTNKWCNPWKIGGSDGSPLSIEIDGLIFEDNEVDSCSIPINLQDSDISDVIINDNTFRDTAGVVYIWTEDGTNPTGILSGFEFTNNDVDSTNTYGVAFFSDAMSPNSNELTDSNFGAGNLINNNQFVEIPGGYGLKSVSLLATLTTYKLNAEDNWWGTYDETEIDALVDNVDYTPWCYDSTCSLDAPQEWVVPLYAGRMNLFSIPVMPASTDIKDVLPLDISSKGVKIWSYQNGGWQYNNNLSSGAWSTASGRLKKIVPGYGYMLFINEDAVAYGNGREIGAEQLPTEGISLSAGWNLLGHLGITAKAASEALSSVNFGDNYRWDKVLELNSDGDGYEVLAEYDGTPDEDMVSTKAYWVSVITNDGPIYL